MTAGLFVFQTSTSAPEAWVAIFLSDTVRENVEVIVVLFRPPDDLLEVPTDSRSPLSESGSPEFSPGTTDWSVKEIPGESELSEPANSKESCCTSEREFDSCDGVAGRKAAPVGFAADAVDVMSK